MARTRKRTGQRLGAVWVAAAGLLAPLARAEEEPRASCSATLSGRRVVARPEAFAFVSPELDRLVRLGMAGRLEVEVTLFRRRALWFDTRVDGARLTQVLAFTPGGYVLDGEPLPEGPGTLELERVAWTLDERPEAGDRFVVQVVVKLHVVTAASLGRVASWLTQEKNAQGEERSGFTRTVLRSVAEDLSRGASGRCEVSRPP